MLPLDRSGNKIRRWRTANREIRGIAGGRWFARTWVGDKESEYANATAAAAAASHKNGDTDKITTPKGGGSISAPLLGKGSNKSKVARAMSGVSAAPSRAGSIIADHHPVKAPSKMRNIVAGPASEEGNDAPVQNTPEQMES
jgi:Wiskott-Aldrich syndrome protein